MPDEQPVPPVIDVSEAGNVSPFGPPGELDRRPSAGPAGVADPATLIRIGTMVQTMLDEVRQVTLDEAGRRRLSEIHERVVAAIKETVSEELRDELTALALPLGEGAPSAAELRVAQAQLLGWLDGLFRGIQAAVFNQQLTAQRQLQELRQGRGPSGNYL